VADFSELVATAIANAETQSKLTASRADRRHRRRDAPANRARPARRRPANGSFSLALG